MIDAVDLDVIDGPGCPADCRETRAPGFRGKGVIHPARIGPADVTLAPAAEDVALAERVVRSFREAEVPGFDAIPDDGKRIDDSMVHNAERVLATAHALDPARSHA